MAEDLAIAIIKKIPSTVGDGIQQALMAGAKVLGDGLMDRVPRGPRGANYNKEFEPLENSMVTFIEVDRSKMYGVSSTGFGASGPVALWNEYGHEIVTRAKVDTGRKTRPNPFMRATVDAVADDVIDAVAESLMRSISKGLGG